MALCVTGSTIISASPSASTAIFPLVSSHVRFCIRSSLNPPLLLSSSSNASPPKASVLLDSLRVLEWGKVCDCVASFAGTPLGREATKEKLSSLDVSYEESKHLLAETAAAVEMIKYGVGGMDFSGVDVVMVQSSIERALRGLSVNGEEALAVAALIQSAETLQISIKASVKEDRDWYNRFLPLTQVILDLPISRQFINFVNQVIDEEGSVKDSASSELKRFRGQVCMLEKKLYQLLDKLIRHDTNEASSLEVNIINGRWCVKMVSDQSMKYEGLLLSSGTGFESLVEPLAAVPLNDELQQARSLVSKAEEEVLSKLTDKMLVEVDDIQRLLNTMIQLDVVIARAKYSLAYGGTFPEVFKRDTNDLLVTEVQSTAKKTPNGATNSHLEQSKWNFYIRRVYHPLLLQQYQENLEKAKKDVNNAASEIRRLRFQGNRVTSNDNMDLSLASLKLRVAKIEEDHPVPVDILVSTKTKVLVITGPNTGGKTISLKTIGLAALMAKSGLYVLASEPVQLPWFDAIFADIGDEQSLSQSLSTFSGHLKQISAIRSISTSQSLVLLDEVGAGTNPLEGAALGMSILESFAESGALLTIATTHHGELKTLKYSNYLFENACVEFDEVNLKPTYMILWGVPGRSNAINVAERLGLSKNIINNARGLYGSASAEINEIITDMERFKQDFHRHLQEAQHILMLARQHHRSLLVTKHKVNEHILTLKSRKLQAVMDTAATARSALRNNLRQFSEVSAAQATKDTTGGSSSSSPKNSPFSAERGNSSPPSVELQNQAKSANTQGEAVSASASSRVTDEKRLPEVGDTVLVSSLGKKATVLKVDASKGEITVQANKMKLRLKLGDIELQQIRTR